MKVIHFANAAESLIKRLLGGSGPPVPKTTNPRLIKLAERLAIDIITDVDCNEPNWTFHRLSSAEQDSFGTILCDEFAIYPASVIRSACIDRIYLCTHLKSPREADGGRAIAFTDMSMYAMNSLVMQLSRSLEYTERTIHHELFHAIDYSDDLLRYADPSWKKLAEPGFLYDREMKFPPDRGGNKDSFMPGFITAYSRMAAHEDKAELYASMILHYAYVMERGEREPVLKRKVQRMKALLRDFHPHFDEKFWQLMNARSYAPKTYNRWIQDHPA